MDLRDKSQVKDFIYKISHGWSLLPFQLTVNISNICNRSCDFCPNHAKNIIPDWHSNWWMQQPKLMDYSKFESFIRRMGIFRLFIRQLSFTGKGETLLHPNILKFCKIANYYKIKFNITTSGDKLTSELEYELSKLPYLNCVWVSLYDVDRADYWLQRQKYSVINIKLKNQTGKHLSGYKDGFIFVNNKGTEKYCTMPKDFVEETRCAAPFSFNTLNTLKWVMYLSNHSGRYGMEKK
jgi:hypothetical protein